VVQVISAAHWACAGVLSDLGRRLFLKMSELVRYLDGDRAAAGKSPRQEIYQRFGRRLTGGDQWALTHSGGQTTPAFE
jgi:hypothetical protein